MFRPFSAKPRTLLIGTIFVLATPCISGSSKRTLRMPFPSQSASSTSSDTVWFTCVVAIKKPPSNYRNRSTKRQPCIEFVPGKQSINPTLHTIQCYHCMFYHIKNLFAGSRTFPLESLNNHSLSPPPFGHSPSFPPPSFPSPHP